MVTITNTRDDTWQFVYLGKKTADYPGGKPDMVELGAKGDHGVVGRVQPQIQITDELYKKIKDQIGEMSAGFEPRIRVVA